MRPALVGRSPLVVAGFLAIAAAPPAPAPVRLLPAAETGIANAHGSVRGYDGRDFAIRAGAGQTLSVRLRSRGTTAYFNVLPPGSQDVAMFIGSTSGGRFAGVAPIAGDYVVRVYLMRSAARRNESSAFTLTARVTGTALVPLATSEDAVLPGTPFHARAMVKCVLPYAPDVRECEASVLRYGRSGTATVELRGPKAFVRRILFVRGAPAASDATRPIESARDGDTTTVSFGEDEHYEIPDVLLTGG